MGLGIKATSLLATARIANVPSVVSNLGVGILLGSMATGGGSSWPWLLTLAAVLFYVGGNFLNDWADRDWDQQHRPERGLPMGYFSEKRFFGTAVVCFGGGLCLAAVYGWLAFSIAVILVWLICYYTRIHKRTSMAVIPMGLCRACLPLLGYAAVRAGISGTVLFPAAALFLYVIALSLNARLEARAEPGRFTESQVRGLLLVAGVAAGILPVMLDPLIGWVGLVPFVVWMGVSVTIFRSPVAAHVSALLAGIPLVDWVILLPLGFIWLRLERFQAGDPMFLTAVGLSPVAFFTGRLLQRLAPAT